MAHSYFTGVPEGYIKHINRGDKEHKQLDEHIDISFSSCNVFTSFIKEEQYRIKQVDNNYNPFKYEEKPSKA